MAEGGMHGWRGHVHPHPDVRSASGHYASTTLRHSLTSSEEFHDARLADNAPKNSLFRQIPSTFPLTSVSMWTQIIRVCHWSRTINENKTNYLPLLHFNFEKGAENTDVL